MTDEITRERERRKCMWSLFSLVQVLRILAFYDCSSSYQISCAEMCNPSPSNLHCEGIRKHSVDYKIEQYFKIVTGYFEQVFRWSDANFGIVRRAFARHRGSWRLKITPDERGGRTELESPLLTRSHGHTCALDQGADSLYTPPYQCHEDRNSHYEDWAVVRPSYLYIGNPILITHLYIESVQQEGQIWIRLIWYMDDYFWPFNLSHFVNRRYRCAFMAWHPVALNWSGNAEGIHLHVSWQTS